MIISGKKMMPAVGILAILMAVVVVQDFCSSMLETLVQLSKGDIDRGSSERSDAVKAGDFGMM